jgi:ATP-binding cassette, subfamily B, bacterial
VTLGTAQMQFQAITQLVGNLSTLGRQVNDIYENYLYVSDYNQFMELSEEDLVAGEKVSIPFARGIEFKNVWFKYPSSPNWILKDVTFTVTPADNIAIIGKNGAGKTTIIKLLCRYYEPQKGEILVNGVNINKYSLSSYRSKISALFQDFAQYPFSANENISFGDIGRNSDKDGIKKAAKLAGIDEFINSLPKGYENALDNEFEGGIEPSKGQWQRLALARAFYRDSEIYILDEPTSNVDPQAEEQIFDEIIKLAKDKIVFLVSHRFSTVRKADKILVLDKGRVEEYGSHEEMLGSGGTYARLFKLQAKAYK